jgi:hypothetical protein
LRCARRRNPHVGRPEQIAAFGDSRCYAFNARTWHRGDTEPSAERLVLFLHYQPAAAPRVPLMLDYVRHRWSRTAAAFRAGPGVRPETKIAPIPLRERVLAAVALLRSR